MNSLWIWFWAGMVFLSIGWYAFLLFYLGIKGGREIFHMTKVLSARPEEKPPEPP
jgi:hypothetical protein